METLRALPSLGLRLRLQPAWFGARFGPDCAARCRHGRTAQRRFVIVGSVANWRLSLQEVDDLYAGERLVFEQSLGKSFEILALFGKDPRRVGEAGLHETANFGVDFLGRGLRNVLLPADRIAEENLVLVLTIHGRAEFLRKSPAGDHGAGQFGGLFDVGLRARGYLLLAEYE